jgi:hypothetical protein
MSTAERSHFPLTSLWWIDNTPIDIRLCASWTFKIYWMRGPLFPYRTHNIFWTIQPLTDGRTGNMGHESRQCWESQSSSLRYQWHGPFHFSEGPSKSSSRYSLHWRVDLPTDTQILDPSFIPSPFGIFLSEVAHFPLLNFAPPLFSTHPPPLAIFSKHSWSCRIRCSAEFFLPLCSTLHC